jgi:predicted ribosomally synthesized peptide with SipW-like signal peptide
MKKKMLLMMLALTVSVALIVGATMAWFTAEDKTKDAEFTAGKVSISADGATPLGDRSLDNVNPGDCYTLEYEITNDGTKVINLRAILNINWEGNLSRDNIYIIPHPSTNWVLYQLEEQEGPEYPIYAYYLGDESEDVAPEETVKLRLVVYFDGEETNNDYMEKKFYVKGKVEAVQASHNAASNVWGEEGWDAVIEGEEFGYEDWYLGDLDPEDIACYTHNFEEPGEDPGEDPGEEPGEDPGEEPGEDPGEDPEPDPEDPELANFGYEVIVKHMWKYTKITVNFSNATDQYGNAFTGEQQYNLRYRTNRTKISNLPPYYSEEFTEEDFTVDFDENGEATFTKVLKPSNKFVNEETTTVEKVVPPAD